MSGKSVPELRFPAYEGAWVNSQLGQCATFSKGKGISKYDIVEGGETPCIRYGELYTTYSTRIDEPVSATNAPTRELHLSQGGEVIVPASGETAEDIATAASVPIPGIALGSDLNVIRGEFNSDFLANMLFAKKRLDLAALAQGNSVVHIYAAQLSSLWINFPSEEEQHRIALFLDVVSRKITLLTEKKFALEDYKRGVMQRLFSRALRFTQDDGSAFPDWAERRLGEVFDWVKTNSLPRSNLTYATDSGVQNIHYGDIHGKFSALFKQSREDVPFINVNALPKIKDEEFIRVGDVVIADASEDYADIGKSIEVLKANEKSLVAGLHTFIARPKKGALALGFPGYMLRSEPVRRRIMRIAQGISVLGISKGKLEKITFEVPHPDEQRKIADFLSAIDAKIDVTSARITEMETFKKGLLQKMFV